MVAHDPGVLLEHLQPFGPPVEFEAQPAEVDGDVLVVIGLDLPVRRAHRDVIAGADDDELAVAGDAVVIGLVDDGGELALGEIEVLDDLGGLLPGVPGVLVPDLPVLGIADAHPQHAAVGGFEVAEDARGDGERHDPLLGALEVDVDGRHRLVPLGLRLPVIVGEFADRPAARARPEGRRVGGRQREQPRPGHPVEGEIEGMLVVRGIEGPVREEDDVLPVPRERRGVVVVLPCRQGRALPTGLHFGDHQAVELLLALRRLRPHEVLPVGGEARGRRLPGPGVPDDVRPAPGDLDEAHGPVVGDRREHLARGIGGQRQHPSERSRPDPPRLLLVREIADLDRVLALGVGDVRGLPGGAEDDGQAHPHRGVRRERPGRTFAMGEVEGLAPPFDHRGVAPVIRGDGADSGAGIKRERLHLRSRQHDVEGADVRVEAVEDLDLAA